MQQVTIHVGLLKTASTTLQSGFAQNPAIEYVDFWKTEAMRKFAHEMAMAGTVMSGSVPVGPLLSILNAATKPVAISDERFSGIPYYSYQDKTAEVTRAFQENCARILHALAPEARIVIVLREPKAWLVSYYKQFIKFGEHRPMKVYCRRFSGHLVQTYSVDFLAELYGSLFGRDRVFVLPFELLRVDETGFLDLLGGIVGAPVTLPKTANQGIADELIEPMRQLNAAMRFLAKRARWADIYADHVKRQLFDVIEGSLTDKARTQEVLIRALSKQAADLDPSEDFLDQLRGAVRQTVTQTPLFAPFRDRYRL